MRILIYIEFFKIFFLSSYCFIQHVFESVYAINMYSDKAFGLIPWKRYIFHIFFKSWNLAQVIFFSVYKKSPPRPTILFHLCRNLSDDAWFCRPSNRLHIFIVHVMKKKQQQNIVHTQVLVYEGANADTYMYVTDFILLYHFIYNHIFTIFTGSSYN